MRVILFSTVFVLSASAAMAADATVTEIQLPDMPMGQVTYPGGKTLTLNRGIGSAAFRDLKDPAGVVWTVTDRGPNLDCEGITAMLICEGVLRFIRAWSRNPTLPIDERNP